jgi:imidazolonepropionase
MSNLQVVENAWLLEEDGRIAAFGKEDTGTIDGFRERFGSSLEVIDAKGGSVFPTWCDAHTHLVYAGSREREFVDRINGLGYQEIFERGGGILNSADRLRMATELELVDGATQRIREMIRMGTGAIEIKSGYGLDVESELKMLRVIRTLRKTLPVEIRSTFLGAHAVPSEYRDDKPGYIRLLTEELMPRIAAEGLADYCDVFCEAGYFTKAETKTVLEAGKRFGMRPKVHAEQLSRSGGIEAGVETGAISVDHLEFISDTDIDQLKASGVMPVLLPGAQLFLGLPSPPARKMISAGLPVALSTDFNPGSCPSGNMNQMISLACILYRMTPAEAILAATTNAAYAMGIADTHGSICVGKQASFFITSPIPSPDYLPYYFGTTVVDRVCLNGIFQS